MTHPGQFGHPCWEKDQADRCINTVAQVTRETVPLFLATHSPIKGIKDVKTNTSVNEEEVFKRFIARKGEIRGVVRGDSGTGKSHLIRWVSLRAEYAAKRKEQGLDQFKIVMVQRDTGSLKAALKQIVDQLGDEFSQYISDIKDSVDKFSAETAREELIQELALEVRSRWEQRGNPPLSNDLKPLGDILLSPGYMKWLGRDGGVVAKKITRLTERSTQDERETDIVFTSGELTAEPQYLNRTQDADQVYEFLEGLEWDDIDSEKVVAVLNKALINAQREFSGIKGAKLHEIFLGIRRRLYTQGKQLAVFIEDVTAASGGLDVDLFQAFEPKTEKGACRMIALLGMTNGGWGLVEDNEKDRVGVEFDVGVNAKKWASDHVEVAQFTARYLNAIRSSDQEINDLAADRFSSDVSYSKCDECKYQGKCHEIFGYAQLDTGAKIGLFPFSPMTPQKMLRSLNEERHRISQRGLLDYVLEFALIASYPLFSQGLFPNPKLIGVNRPVLTYWTEIENKYLGGMAWNSGMKDRTRFLTQFWVDADSSDEAVLSLAKYSDPFSLPKFSSETTVITKTISKKKKTKTEDGSTVSPTEDKELKRLLATLDRWEEGKTLLYDAEFRKYLLNFLSKAMRWQDYRRFPVKEKKIITKDIKPIRIEGQQSRPASQHYFLDFSRDKATRELLEALVRYDREGKKSWDFNYGELHKRCVSRWLNRNKQRIVKSIAPTPPSLQQEVIRSASQFLALVATIRRMVPLPIHEPQKRILELFIPIWTDIDEPKFCCQSMKALVVDMKIKWERITNLLISELGVGQGEAAPKDFIDPIPILSSLDKFEEYPVVSVPSGEIGKSFWKKRFEPVSSLGTYRELPKKLSEELEQINKRLNTIKTFLADSGFSGNDLQQETQDCLGELIELIRVERENIKYPTDLRFVSLGESILSEEERESWGICLAQASELCDDPTDIAILCHDASILNKIFDSQILIKNYLLAIDKELTEQESPGGNITGGTKKNLLSELQELSEIITKG